MATHDYVIANGTGAAVRSDLNNALAAIVSNNSSATEPATTYAYMWWADTTAGQLKLRNAADNAWVTIQELDGTMLMEDGTAGAPGLAFASDLDTGFYRPAANELGIATNGTNAVYIDDAQQVGIGTATPGRTLDVNGIIRSDGTSGALAFGGNSSTPSEGAAIHRPAANTLAFVTNSTEAARIDSSGRLLVGTSSSSSSSMGMVQQGSAGIASAAANLLLAKDTSSVSDGTSLGTIYFSDSSHDLAAYINCDRDGGTWTSTSSQPTRLTFATTEDGASSPTERMRITNRGHVVVDSLNSTDTLFLGTEQSAGTSQSLIFGVSGRSGGSGGSGVFLVYTNGNVVNTNNSYGAISDIKLKENIVNASSQWDDLKAIQVRNYNFKEEAGRQTHTQLGVIAQEIELVSPGLVTESPDRDEDGNDLGTTTKAVNYSVLYMKAVKALQEAMERIETLEAKVAALESA